MEAITKPNQLEIIVQQSGLETTKANILLEKFKDYFAIASEWEIKAKTIVVKDASQAADMAMARVGRLHLRDKRLAIENARKELKEQSLREGKAIDGIANVLKALIIPIEEYLDKQEHFVEIRAKEEAEKKRIEEERQAEQDRLAKEKAEREEQERIRRENERLKKEAELKEKQIQKEREEAEQKLAAERARAEKEKREAEEKAKKAQAEADAKIRAEREKADAEKKALEARLAAMVECPNCHHKFVPGE